MSLTILSRPPWRLKGFATLCLILASLIPASMAQDPDSSRDLTKKLLKMDLGYNVLNNEMLRQSIGVSVDTLDNLEDESNDNEERLPIPQHLQIWRPQSRRPLV